MSNPTPPQEDIRRRLSDIGHAVDERLPEGFGFFVLVFPFSENADNRANYISNAKREDVLNVMKEFLLRNGASEDWMKHIH